MVRRWREEGPLRQRDSPGRRKGNRARRRQEPQLVRFRLQRPHVMLEARATKNGKAKTACEESCHTHAIRLVDLHVYRAALTKARAAEIARAHRDIPFAF